MRFLSISGTAGGHEALLLQASSVVLWFTHSDPYCKILFLCEVLGNRECFQKKVIENIATLYRKRSSSKKKSFDMYSYAVTAQDGLPPPHVYNYEPFFKSVFQDRLTFRRIIVKNNAKKRRLYEAFIETLPLLTSLEVNINVHPASRKCSVLLQ